MKKFFILTACLFVVAGCGSDNTKTNAENNEAAPSQTTPNTTAEAAKANKASSGLVYRVATTGKQPPFSYQDEKGNLIGMDIDIMRAIAETQGASVEFEMQPWSNVFLSVTSGSNDLAISGISYNDERNAQYALSKKYLFVPSAIMVTDKNIRSLQDLAGKRFNCMKDAKQCNDIASAVPSATISEENTTFLTFKSLAQGKTDAIGEDVQLLQYFAKKHPEVKAHIVAYETEQNPQSAQVIMAAKDKKELIAKINDSIDKLTASGKIKEIEKKWLDNPY